MPGWGQGRKSRIARFTQSGAVSPAGHTTPQVSRAHLARIAARSLLANGDQSAEYTQLGYSGRLTLTIGANAGKDAGVWAGPGGNFDLLVRNGRDAAVRPQRIPNRRAAVTGGSLSTRRCPIASDCRWLIDPIRKISECATILRPPVGLRGIGHLVDNRSCGGNHTERLHPSEKPDSGQEVHVWRPVDYPQPSIFVKHQNRSSVDGANVNDPPSANRGPELPAHGTRLPCQLGPCVQCWSPETNHTLMNLKHGGDIEYRLRRTRFCRRFSLPYSEQEAAG